MEKNKLIMIDTLMGKMPVSYEWQYDRTIGLLEHYAEEAMVDVIEEHNAEIDEETLRSESTKRLIDYTSHFAKDDYIMNNWGTLLNILCKKANHQYGELVEILDKGFDYFYEVLMEYKIDEIYDTVQEAMQQAIDDKSPIDYDSLPEEEEE